MGKAGRPRRSHPPAAAAAGRAAVANVIWPARREVVLVLAVALGWRLLYWLLYRSTPFYTSPIVDASFFHIWAQSIVQGQDFQPDVFFKPPLYPYVLAFLYRLIGTSLPVVFLLQTLLGTASCLLILLIGRLVFPARIASAGALIAASLPLLPFFEFQLLAETLTTFLSFLAIWQVLLADRDRTGPRRRLLLGAGLALGIAALGRPNLLVLPPILAVWVWRAPHAEKSPRHHDPTWQAALMLLVGTILALAPVTLRNARVGGTLVPVCANFGVNLWTGHHEGADGTSAVPVGVRWDDLQLRCQQAGAGSAVASSRFLSAEAMRYILDHPGRALAITVKKFAVMLSASEVRNNIGAAFLAQYEGVFMLRRWWPGFWLVGPFALVGLWGARRWVRPGQVLWLYLAALFLSVLPFFANARFRMPLLPVLALWSAAGAVDLGRAWRDWRAGRVSPGAPGRLLVVLVLGALLVNVDWYDLDRPAQHARDHFYLGTIQAKGWQENPPNPRAARDQFRRAAELDPHDPDFPERHGQLLLSLAQPLAQRAESFLASRQWELATVYADSAAPLLREALVLHQRAADLLPRSFRSHSNQGTCHMWLGDGRTARAEVALAHRDTAGAVETAEQALARYNAAGRSYQQALLIWPSFPEAAGNLQLCVERILALPTLTEEIGQAQARLSESRLDKR